jgi:bifunctional non-homologous end joining protein LigD
VRVPSDHVAKKQARAPAANLPRWTGPLTAELALLSRAAPFSALGWLYELKYDGWRILVAKDGERATLRLRSGRDATATFPEIVKATATLPVRRALLDGELVIFARDGRSDFDALRRRALPRGEGRASEPATACLFDLLALDDHDCRQLALTERKRILKDVLTDHHQLVYVDHIEARGEQLLTGARNLGLEGIVAKRINSAYVPGRTRAWLKFKIEDSRDFVVIGAAEPSEATFRRPGLVLAVVQSHGLRYVGRVGVGWRELHVLDSVLPLLQRDAAPCSGAGRAAMWLTPAIVAEVRFLASSRRGLRHAVFLRFRPDKLWQECTD